MKKRDKVPYRINQHPQDKMMIEAYVTSGDETILMWVAHVDAIYPTLTEHQIKQVEEGGEVWISSVGI